MKLFLDVGDLGHKPPTQRVNSQSPKKRAKSPAKDPVAKKPRKEKPEKKIPPEKSKSQITTKTEVPDNVDELCPKDPKHCVGLRIAKYFDAELYFGSIDAANSDTEAESGFFYHVTYDDGDQEDLDRKELEDSRFL